MAVSDLLGPLFSWPLYASEGMLTQNILISEPWATNVCKLGMYFRAVSQIVSVLSLVLIALDRFVAIVFPLKAIMLKVKVRVILLSISWLIPLLCALPYALFSRITVIEEQILCRFIMSEEALTVISASGVSLFYFVPLITIIVLYSVILRSLKKRPKPGSLQTNQENVQRREQNQRILKILISIVVAFFICWTPLCIYLFLRKFYPALFPKDRCLLISGFTFYVFPSLSTAVNPVILFVFSTNYNQALRKLCSQAFSPCKRRFFQRNKPGNMAMQEEQNLEMIDTKILD